MATNYLQADFGAWKVLEIICGRISTLNSADDRERELIIAGILSDVSKVEVYADANKRLSKFRILLYPLENGLGVQVTGRFDQQGGPETAVIEYHYENMPWVTLRGLNEVQQGSLLCYARHFHFGYDPVADASALSPQVLSELSFIRPPTL